MFSLSVSPSSGAVWVDVDSFVGGVVFVVLTLCIVILWALHDHSKIAPCGMIKVFWTALNWMSWAPILNGPYSLCGRKAILKRNCQPCLFSDVWHAGLSHTQVVKGKQLWYWTYSSQLCHSAWLSPFCCSLSFFCFVCVYAFCCCCWSPPVCAHWHSYNDKLHVYSFHWWTVTKQHVFGFLQKRQCERPASPQPENRTQALSGGRPVQSQPAAGWTGASDVTALNSFQCQPARLWRWSQSSHCLWLSLTLATRNSNEATENNQQAQQDLERMKSEWMRRQPVM